MSMPLATSVYDWLLILHILAVTVWLGGIITINVFATLVLRGRDLDLVTRFVGSLRIVGPIVLAPSILAVLVFGIWMVVDSSAWNFGQAWIITALVPTSCRIHPRSRLPGTRGDRNAACG